MVFSSPLFLFYFLPLALLVYYLTPKRYSHYTIFLTSMVFYSAGELVYFSLLLATVAVDYSIGRGLAAALRRAKESGADPSTVERRRKLLLAASVCFNLGMLFFFKYANLFVEFVNETAILLFGFQDILIPPPGIVLPLGISFYIFQSISYTIDVYRGDVEATDSLVKFAAFVTFFPQLIAGPIVRYRDIATDLDNPNCSSAMIAEGIRRFTLGLTKKVLLANTFAIPTDLIFDGSPKDWTMALTWLGAVTFTMQVYYDFSGYSDMAIGLGKMFGVNFRENFRYPFTADSMTDFWTKWHISLSTWFRDYLFIPLGGSRHGEWKTVRNLSIVFVLCGLWHGASASYAVWGVYNGIVMITERYWPERLSLKKSNPLRIPYGFFTVVFGLVIFRTENLGEAWLYYQAMFGYGPGNNELLYPGLFFNPEFLFVYLVGFLWSFSWFHDAREWLVSKWQQSPGAFHIIEMLWLFFLFVSCVISLSAATHNPFIYFRF